MEKMFVFSLYFSVEVDVLRLYVVFVFYVWQGVDRQGNVGKKNSRKRRNRKENKIVYFFWFLILQIQVLFVVLVLGQICVIGVLLVVDIGMDVGYEIRQ